LRKKMPRATNGIKPNISVIIDVEPHFKSYQKELV
jgi:hypothetical protein